VTDKVTRKHYVAMSSEPIQPQGELSDISTITNTYGSDELKITKKLLNYLQCDQGLETAVVFDIKGYYAGEKEPAYHNQVGMTFNGPDTEGQTLTITNIPLGLDHIVVEEIYSPNYKPSDGEYKHTITEYTTETLENKTTKRIYSTEFTNEYNDKTQYNSGIVNKYKFDTETKHYGYVPTESPN